MSRVMLVGVLLGGLTATTAWAQEGLVLLVGPEGIVVDAVALGRLERGGRLEFVRPAGGRSLMGYGTVTSVRGARALVAPDPGSWVREGDVAVRCPASEAQGYQQLEQTVGQLQATSLPLELRGLADRLQWALAARAAIVRDGRCDTLATDQEIARLTEALQLAAGPGHGPLQPGLHRPAVPPGQESYPAGPFPRVQGSPGPGPYASSAPAPGQSAESATTGGDVIDRAGRLVDVLAKMAAVAQGLGLAPNRRGASGGSTSAGGGQPPEIGYPPSGTYPSEGSYPPSSGWGSPPARGDYSPGTGSTAPPGTGWPGAGSAPGPSPEGGGSGSGRGRGGFSLWGTPGKSATGTDPGGSGGTGGVATKSPGAAAALLAKRATVTGYVRSESGQAIAAALVSVSVTVVGTQVKTETRTDGTGAFTIAGLPPGPFVMTVSAPGYVNGTRTGTFDRGETERVEVRLKRFGVLGVPGR